MSELRPLPRESSSRQGLTSTSSHDNSGQRSPSPLTASIIPPPIVQSTYEFSPRNRTATRPAFDERSPLLDERQSDIESDLQFFLDSQAEGLLKGLGADRRSDELASTGSATPNASSVRRTVGRRPKSGSRNRRPGLRGARDGLHASVMSLSELKVEELQDVETELGDVEQTLEQIDEWETKRRGLEDATRQLREEEDQVRLVSLQGEADALQREIHDAENRLEDMKSRHRKLVQQAATIENGIQAKLASYKSSLRILDEHVQRFLSSDPRPRNHTPSIGGGSASFWRLPTNRKTLAMAKTHLSEEREVFLRRRNSIEHEKEASQQGAALWKEVVGQVTDFERRLASEMRAQAMPPSDPEAAWDETPQQDSAVRLKQILQEMIVLIGYLDSKMETAKARRWNLLVAAIGAEVDALRQGQKLVEGVVGVNDQPDAPCAEKSEAPSSGATGVVEGDVIHQLDQSFQAAIKDSSGGQDAEVEDDPDPELLFSQLAVDRE